VQYKQQANPLLSMHSYIPLVISKNDKKKQLKLFIFFFNYLLGLSI
jgi:hypothetical protein